MQIDKSYVNRPFHLGKIHTDVGSVRHKNKIRRTYGWDCPYQEYESDRHYNTQRHINLTHGSGSGEPVDHMTGETREEKRRAANGSCNQSMNMSAYRNTSSMSPPVRYPDTILPTLNPDPIRMPYLEAQERRAKELCYPVRAQPPNSYPTHPGPTDWANASNPPYRKNFSFSLNEDRAGPYLSNAKQIHEPFYSVDASSGPILGPLAVYIKILLDHMRLRKCLRQI